MCIYACTAKYMHAIAVLLTAIFNCARVKEKEKALKDANEKKIL